MRRMPDRSLSPGSTSPNSPNASARCFAASTSASSISPSTSCQRREHIGFVYQSFNLVPTLNVADNVRLVLELNKVPPSQASARINKLLESVGLADRGDSYPDVLSGGEQQRIAIARALAHEPAVLLADEPTGNLDDATAESVLGLLEKLVRDNGHTMLIATHSQHIASHCDRVLELHNGRIATAGIT